jgi:hypothetical protein
LLRAVGIAVATLATTGCVRGGDLALGWAKSPPEERIRGCWRELEQVAKDAGRLTELAAGV